MNQSSDGSVSGSGKGGPFICPECLCETADSTMLPSPDPSVRPEDRTAWYFVLQTIECGGCSMSIPAHLAERWGGISLEQAREEWRTIFRPSSGV